MSLDVNISGKIYSQYTCNHCSQTNQVEVEDFCFSANITNNLNTMAHEAGIYEYVWRPENLGITKAKELIIPIKEGIDLLKSDKERFEVFNAPNGWGTYADFIPWLEKYLEACIKCPEGLISVSR